MIVSGVSGNATFDQQKRFPFMFNGHSLKLDYTKTFYELKLQQTSGGTISGSPVSGESGTKFNLSATPLTNHWHLDSYGVSGATMTGSSGTYTSADVSAKPSWHEDPKYTLTLQQQTGGTLASNKTSGYQNDTFTLTPTPAYRYKFSSYSTTGTTMTGNNGKFNTSNVTAKANFYYSPNVITVGTFPMNGMFQPRLAVSNSAYPNKSYLSIFPGQDLSELYVSKAPRLSGKYVTGGYDMVYWSMYEWLVWPTLAPTDLTNTASYSAASQFIRNLNYSAAITAAYNNRDRFFNPRQDIGNVQGSPTSAVANGFAFANDDCFISAFRGDLCLYCDDKALSWRVIRNGVTSDWNRVSGRWVAVPFTFFQGNLSGNEPFKIQVSGWSITGNELAYTTGAGGISYPCWSGKLCYYE